MCCKAKIPEGSCQVSIAPSSANRSSNMTEAIPLGTLPNTHWAGLNPPTLLLSFFTIRTWLRHCSTHSLPIAPTSNATRQYIALHHVVLFSPQEALGTPMEHDTLVCRVHPYILLKHTSVMQPSVAHNANCPGYPTTSETVQAITT